MPLPNKLKKYDGPPFDTAKLKKFLNRNETPPKIVDIAKTLGVTHVTVLRYLAGYEVPLSMAMTIRNIFAPGVPLEELWRPR